MVPLNKNKFVLDLIKNLKAKVIIVSKNELGSINHSLLTAAVLKKEKIDVAGWIFNEEYLHYENEIEKWSGYPIIASVKHLPEITKETIKAESEKIKKTPSKIFMTKAALRKVYKEKRLQLISSAKLKNLLIFFLLIFNKYNFRFFHAFILISLLKN